MSLNGVDAGSTRFEHVTSVRPSACVYLGPLQPGVNEFSVGVRYRH